MDQRVDLPAGVLGVLLAEAVGTDADCYQPGLAVLAAQLFGSAAGVVADGADQGVEVVRQLGCGW